MAKRPRTTRAEEFTLIRGSRPTQPTTSTPQLLSFDLHGPGFESSAEDPFVVA